MNINEMNTKKYSESSRVSSSSQNVSHPWQKYELILLGFADAQEGEDKKKTVKLYLELAPHFAMSYTRSASSIEGKLRHNKNNGFGIVDIRALYGDNISLLSGFNDSNKKDKIQKLRSLVSAEKTVQMMLLAYACFICEGIEDVSTDAILKKYEEVVGVVGINKPIETKKLQSHILVFLSDDSNAMDDLVQQYVSKGVFKKSRGIEVDKDAMLSAAADIQEDTHKTLYPTSSNNNSNNKKTKSRKNKAKETTKSSKIAKLLKRQCKEAIEKKKENLAEEYKQQEKLLEKEYVTGKNPITKKLLELQKQITELQTNMDELDATHNEKKMNLTKKRDQDVRDLYTSENMGEQYQLLVKEHFLKLSKRFVKTT